MALEITGKITEIGQLQQITERFSKREFVLDISEEKDGTVYQNYAKMQVTNKNCDKLDSFRIGDTVKVSFNVRGNRWEKDGKVNYINSLDAWRLEMVQENTSVNVVNSPGIGADTSDDLPF